MTGGDRLREGGAAEGATQAGLGNMGVSVGIDLAAAACAAARAEEGRAEACPIDEGAVVPPLGDVDGTASLLSAVARRCVPGDAPPDAVAVTYPPTLDPDALAARARAAAEAFDAPLLVPRPVATAAWYVHDAADAPTRLLVVVHADATDLEVAVVRREAGALTVAGARALGQPPTAETLDHAADLVASAGGGLTPDRVLLAGGSPLVGDLAGRVVAASGQQVEVVRQPAGAAALGAALLAATAEGRSTYGLGAAAGAAGVATMPAVVGPAGAPQGALGAAPAGGAVGAEIGGVGGAVGDAIGTPAGGSARQAARLHGAGDAPAGSPGSALGGAVGASRLLRLPLGRPKRPVAVGLAVLAGVLVLGAATVVAGGSGGGDGGSAVDVATGGEASPPDGGTATSGGTAGGTGGAKPPPGDPAASTSTTATTDTDPGAEPGTTGTPGTTGAPGAPTPGGPPPSGATTTTAPPRDTAGPAITGLSRSPADIDEGGSEFCTRPTVSWVSASVTDPSGVATVTAHWSTSGASGSVKMSLANNTWQAGVAPGVIRTLQYPNTAAVTWYVTATDGAGNRATSGSGPSITLHGC